MLDKRTKRLLDALLQICGEDGTYKIVEIIDMLRVMSRYKMDAEVLGQCLRFLADAEMIDIKHADDAVYAIAILPKGRVHEETEGRKRNNAVLGRGLVFLIVFGSFLAAIVGAVVGGVLVGLLD